MSNETTAVGFIGLGDMGGAIVPHIIEAGYPVTLWARRDASLEQYDNERFTKAETIAALGERCDIVGVCVFDENDVRGVLTELLPAMTAGGVVLIHATVSVEASHEFAELGQANSVDVLDAPVSGSREGAIAGTLAVMVGGDEPAFKKAEPVMSTYGACVRFLGPTGSGQKMKVLNNTLVAVNLRTAHEALEVAAGIGLNEASVNELLMASTASSVSLRSLVTKLRIDPPRARHSVRMIEKDVAVFKRVCESAGVEEGLLDDLAAEAVAVVRELGNRE